MTRHRSLTEHQYFLLIVGHEDLIDRWQLQLNLRIIKYLKPSEFVPKNNARTNCTEY